MITSFIKVAYRNILRNKLFSIINIFGLAVGMAVCILLTISASFEFKMDKFHENIDYIFRVIQVGVTNEGERYGNSITPYMLSPVLKEKFPEIKDFVRIRSAGNAYIKIEETEFQDYVIYAEPSLFDIFSFNLLQGNSEDVFSDINSVVLSRSIAKKYFKDANPVGKIINFNNSIDLVVTGIVEDSPANSSITYDLIIPFKLIGEDKINSWSWESSSFVLLEEGIDFNALSEKIKNVIHDYQKQNTNTVRLQSLKKVALYDGLDKPSRLNFIMIEFSIAILILLLAVINFINLTTAKSAKRAREIGVRKVVGAQKKHLIIQFLGESVFIAFISLLIALVLVELLMPFYKDLVQKDISLNIFSLINILGIILFTVFIGIVAGLYPAFYFSRVNIVHVLKNMPVLKSKHFFRSVLVVFQFSVSTALIICTITVQYQLKYLLNKDLGFSKSNIISLRWNSDLEKNYQEFKDLLFRNPNIKGITKSTSSPSYIGNVNPPTWSEKQGDDWLLFNFVNTDNHFVDVFDMQIINGKNFDLDFTGRGTVQYILNEKAVRLMGYEPYDSGIIGKRFSMWDESIAGQIVGVVKDFHFQPLMNEINPIMITNINWWSSYCFIKFDAKNLLETISFIEKSYSKFSPNYSISYTFLDKDIESQYLFVKNLSKSIGFASVLAIIISILGLTGLTLFVTESRTKEIGIRKVMGASTIKVILLLAKDFIRLILCSNFFAWSIAFYAMNKYLKMFAYATSQSVIIYLFASFLTLFVAFVLIFSLTFKIAKSNPVNSLKYE